MPKVEWMPRELFRSPVYYCLCTSQKEFDAELRKLNIKDSKSWLKNAHSSATTHFLDGPSGDVCAVVCLPINPEKTRIEHYGLLVHEGMHIWREIREHIGEHSPSSEFEAYAIQRIAINLMHQFERHFAYADARTRDRLEAISQSTVDGDLPDRLKRTRVDAAASGTDDSGISSAGK